GGLSLRDWLSRGGYRNAIASAPWQARPVCSPTEPLRRRLIMEAAMPPTTTTALVERALTEARRSRWIRRDRSQSWLRADPVLPHCATITGQSLAIFSV